MLPSNKNPKWWQIYLTFPLLIALFVLDHQLKISTRGHQAVQIGGVLVVYGLIHLWLKANARALSGMDQRQLPDSEIKGILSDTFDMNIIDATLLPIDDVSQEINKE